LISNLNGLLIELEGEGWRCTILKSFVCGYKIRIKRVVARWQRFLRR
jgi:hypothetical protein